MVHRAGVKRVYVPLPLEHWMFLRGLAARRNTSMASELGAIARTELERQQMRQKRDSNGDETTAPTDGVTPRPD